MATLLVTILQRLLTLIVTNYQSITTYVIECIVP